MPFLVLFLTWTHASSLVDFTGHHAIRYVPRLMSKIQIATTGTPGASADLPNKEKYVRGTSEARLE